MTTEKFLSVTCILLLAVSFLIIGNAHIYGAGAGAIVVLPQIVLWSWALNTKD